MKLWKILSFLLVTVLGRLGWQDLSCCHWSLCTFFCPRDVIPQQWRMTGLVMFCFVLGSWADRVCIFPSRSPHFLFSGILHHLGMGLLCIWASGLMDLSFFPFKVFQHIDIMSHHALLQYSSLFPFIWNQDNPIMCPRRTIGLESSLSLGQTGYKRGIVPQCQTYVALSWGSCDVLKERTWRVAKYGVPYSEFVLCISPIQVHTHTHTHTVNTSCQTWDSNPQPSGCKSDSLSIRPQLPPVFFFFYKGKCLLRHSHELLFFTVKFVAVIFNLFRLP